MDLKRQPRKPAGTPEGGQYSSGSLNSSHLDRSGFKDPFAAPSEQNETTAQGYDWRELRLPEGHPDWENMPEFQLAVREGIDDSLQFEGIEAAQATCQSNIDRYQKKLDETMKLYGPEQAAYYAEMIRIVDGELREALSFRAVK